MQIMENILCITENNAIIQTWVQLLRIVQICPMNKCGKKTVKKMNLIDMIQKVW